MLRTLVFGRFFAAFGEILFRIVAANLAFQASGSKWLVALIVVLPNIASALARIVLSKLFTRTPNFGRMCASLDLFRSALFLSFAFWANFYTALAVLLLSGCVQALFEGSLGGSLASLKLSHQASRTYNAFLRMAFLCGGLSGALTSNATTLSLGQAGLCATIGFFVSAVIFWRVFPQTLTTELTSTQAIISGFHLLDSTLIRSYFIAAFGLSVAAPSMVGVAHALLDHSALASWNVYGLYQAVVLVGSVLAMGFVRRFWDKSVPDIALLVPALGILANAVFFVTQQSGIFLVVTILSSFCETLLVVEINSFLQRTLSPAASAQASFMLRTQLALVAFVGLLVNVILAKYMGPVLIAATAAGFCVIVLLLHFVTATQARGIEA